LRLLEKHIARHPDVYVEDALATSLLIPSLSSGFGIQSATFRLSASRVPMKRRSSDPPPCPRTWQPLSCVGPILCFECSCPFPRDVTQSFFLVLENSHPASYFCLCSPELSRATLAYLTLPHLQPAFPFVSRKSTSYLL